MEVIYLIDYWPLTKEKYVLYINDKDIIKLAKENNFNLMAEYFKQDKLIASQFTGPKEQVVYFVNSINKSSKKCISCNTLFLPSNNKQKYCSVCAKEIANQQKRDSKQRRRGYISSMDEK